MGMHAFRRLRALQGAAEASTLIATVVAERVNNPAQPAEFAEPAPAVVPTESAPQKTRRPRKPQPTAVEN